MTTEPSAWLRSVWSRGLSLLLTTPLALLLLIHPAAMLDAQGGYSHGLLMLVMWGISSGFIHGVGFDARGRVWRLLFHPLLGWLLLGLGYGILLRAQLS